MDGHTTITLTNKSRPSKDFESHSEEEGEKKVVVAGSTIRITRFTWNGHEDRSGDDVRDTGHDSYVAV
jgi:hypothetical protein